MNSHHYPATQLILVTVDASVCNALMHENSQCCPNYGSLSESLKGKL